LFALDRKQKIPPNSGSARDLGPGPIPRRQKPHNFLFNKA
jgi:hypothetical protein